MNIVNEIILQGTFIFHMSRHIFCNKMPSAKQTSLIAHGMQKPSQTYQEFIICLDYLPEN